MESIWKDSSETEKKFFELKQELENLNEEKKQLKKVNRQLHGLAVKHLRNDGFSADELQDFLPTLDKAESAFFEILDEFEKKERQTALFQTNSEKRIKSLEHDLNEVHSTGDEALQRLSQLQGDVISMDTNSNSKYTQENVNHFFESIKQLNTQLKEQRTSNALLEQKLAEYPATKSTYKAQVEKLKHSIEETARKKDNMACSVKEWQLKIETSDEEHFRSKGVLRKLKSDVQVKEETLKQLRTDFQKKLAELNKKKQTLEQTCSNRMPVYPAPVLNEYNKMLIHAQNLRQKITKLKK